MAEATNPIATASNPRVGPLERVRHLKRGTEYEVLGEAEAQISTRYESDRFGNWIGLYEGHTLVVYRCVETGKLWCRPPEEFRDGRFQTIASAPTPPDRVGEEVGREEEIAALILKEVPGASDWPNIVEDVARQIAGKLASAPSPEAGAGGDLAGEPSGTGSREPGPSVPASGFDPSRVDRIWDDETRNILEAEADQKIEATARTLPFEVNKHFWTIKAHVTGIFDHSEDPHVRDDAVAIKSSLADLADALALGTEAGTAETFGLGPKDDGPADLSATPDLLSHLITENANLRDRVREAEKGAEAMRGACLKAAISASYGPPSSWPGPYPKGWKHPPCWEPGQKPTPDQAAWHDNGARDAWFAIRALAAPPVGLSEKGGSGAA